MKFYFDYIYYRMYKAFFKWDGDEAARALCGVTMIQVLIISEIIYTCLRQFFSHQQMKPFGKEIAWSFVIIGILLYVLNYKKYKGKFDKYNDHWKMEPENKKKLKGLLVILSLIAPWILFILMTDLIG